MPPASLKLVILDRDGTINEDRDDYVKSPDEWVPLPGSLEAISRLNHAGWHTVLATNQSGLGRGLFDMASMNAIQLKLNQALALQGGRIDAVFFCPHAPDDGCDCRKPLPGMMHQIAERFGVSLDNTPMVGDNLTRMLVAGPVVFLDVSMEVLMPRIIRSGGDRPLLLGLKGEALRDRVETLLADRMPAYSGASVVVDGDGTPEEVAQRIQEVL